MNKEELKQPQEETLPQRKVLLGEKIQLCISAWLIPGAGHLFLGLRWRALVLFGAINGMFLFGLVMQGRFFELTPGSWLRSLGFLGECCVGIVLPLAHWFGYGGGDPFFISYDYGTAFLVAAGMLNILCILDVYDIAMGRKP